MGVSVGVGVGVSVIVGVGVGVFVGVVVGVSVGVGVGVSDSLKSSPDTKTFVDPVVVPDDAVIPDIIVMFPTFLPKIFVNWISTFVSNILLKVSS